MGIEIAGIKTTKSGLRMGNVDLGRLDQVGKRTFRNCAKDWNNWKGALPSIRKRLGEVMIYEKDALEFIRLMDSAETLQYIDPPYHHDTRSSTRYQVEFDRHEELVATLIRLKGMVVLSGYDTDIYNPLTVSGWAKITKESRANMSPDRRTECLWISPVATKARLL